MHKVLVRLILALFILGVINPGVGSAVVSNTDLNDYYQSCINKQSQVLPLVKNVQVKINMDGPDYCFAKPFWTGSIPANPVTSIYTSASEKAQNIHCQQYLQLLLYPPHFFG